MTDSSIISKIWNLANVLRDNGVGYGDYCNWETLISKRGSELEAFYMQMLRSLSTEKGMLGQIFTKS